MTAAGLVLRSERAYALARAGPASVTAVIMTAIAAFAAAFTSLAGFGIVVLLACLLPRAGLVRLAALAAGAVMGIAEAMAGGSAAELLLLPLGGMVASLLHAEIMLHLVLPLCRFGWRAFLLVVELAGDVAAFLLRAGRRHRAAGKDQAPPSAPPPERAPDYLPAPFDPWP